jgi:hypothetical protein
VPHHLEIAFRQIETHPMEQSRTSRFSDGGAPCLSLVGA